MKLSSVTQPFLAALVIFPAVAYADEKSGESVFSPLTISGNAITENNQPGSSAETYHQPGAYSSRAFNQYLQNADETFRSMPGSYTQIDQAQGMVSVNIRGMAGLGRVNTMVDGVTQTYFSQAPTSYHGLGNRDAGVLIDPNFLAGVDITRGDSAGVQGINALAGSANMRTIDLDDVLRQGRNIGALSRFSLGNNGLGRSGMITAAGKTAIFNTGSLGALAGFSGSKTYASYVNGAGLSSDKFLGDDIKYMNSLPHSQLFKFYVNPTENNKLEFAIRNFTNTYTRRFLRSTDYYLKYNYTPATELIDLSVLASNSRAHQIYQPESLYNFNNVTLKNNSNALVIENTSRFTLANIDTAWLFGGKLMDNRYTRSFYQDVFTESNDFAPVGTQKISALYTGVILNRNIYQLDINTNYTRSKVQGYKPACDATEICFPQGAATLNIDDTSVNPTVTLSAQITPWLQPFVNWSRATRVPNVQEAFFANEGGASVNPFLKPETATTWQAGFNINKHGLISENDIFRLKALAYQSRIKDYITSVSFFLNNGHLVREYSNDVKADFNAYVYINTPDPVRSRGYEIEAMYDLGFAYLNVTWSHQHTDQPTSIASNTTLGFGYGDISDLPDNYGTLNIGTRLLDQKLVIGGLVKFTGKSKRLDPYGVDVDTSQVKKEDLPNVPTIIDLYSSYQVNKNITLTLSVQNLTNRNYAAALNRLNQNLSYAPEGASITPTARGRTWVLGGQIRF